MPKTMAELEKEIEALKEIVNGLQHTIQNKDHEIQIWKENYFLIRQKLFGKSSEKKHFEKDPQYLLFDVTVNFSTFLQLLQD